MGGWLAEVSGRRYPGGMGPAHPDLIYDVGVCNGDDSAYYLHKGYRVVGVEANPLLLEPLRRRFAAEIRDGCYELLGFGIDAEPGEAPFWVCDDHPEWSSFDRSIASRNGARHHCVEVPTCRFASLLGRFGRGAYCKIDIEGNDELCLQDMTDATAPQFVSVELMDAQRQIRRMQELGYTRFKIISQRTLRPPGTGMAGLKARLPRPLRSLVVSGEARLFRHKADGSWTFPLGSSGPFGEDTPGKWQSAEHSLELGRLVGSDLSDWYDIHAARCPASEAG